MIYSYVVWIKNMYDSDNDTRYMILLLFNMYTTFQVKTHIKCVMKYTITWKNPTAACW